MSCGKEYWRDVDLIYEKKIKEKKGKLISLFACRLNRCDDFPFLGRRTSTAYGIVRLLNLLYEIKQQAMKTCSSPWAVKVPSSAR